MTEPRWEPEDEAAWEEKARQAAREAWNAWHRAGRPSSGEEDDTALMQALAPVPREKEKYQKKATGGSAPGGPNPTRQEGKGKIPEEDTRQKTSGPGGSSTPRRCKKGGIRSGLTADPESLLLWILIFVLWREGADKEILLAMAYILLV